MTTKTTAHTAADFVGMAWVEIDGWMTVGGYGDAFALITTALINRNRDTKQKGTRNAGSMENTFSALPADAGQIAAAAAVRTTNNYGFRVLHPTGEADMFVGLPMGFTEAGGEANAVRSRTLSIEINSNIVTV
jgi:hypothetical protein